MAAQCDRSWKMEDGRWKLARNERTFGRVGSEKLLFVSYRLSVNARYRCIAYNLDTP